MPRKPPSFYFERLKRMARGRGGRLLSRRYLGDATRLRFRCAAGHTFMQKPGAVQQGKWCTTCGRVRGARTQAEATGRRLYRIVARRGGTVLSPAYVNNHTRLRFKCREGHEWATVPTVILYGGWCPRCPKPGRLRANARRRAEAVRRMRAVAGRRRGRLLSMRRTNGRTLASFRCGRGHVWETVPQSVDEGAWCAKCKELSWLDKYAAVARERGGGLLSTRYVGQHAPLDWRCARGHRFKLSTASIRVGTWCKQCRELKLGQLERMRRVARARGGECLSPRYTTHLTLLRWRCREGHEWLARPSAIVQGSWCRRCFDESRAGRRRWSLDMMRRIAAERGGRCLSESYHRPHQRLRWRCARGHLWKGLAYHVVAGHWCRVCSNAVRGTLERFREMARQHGGRCVSRDWTNHRKALQFECARGHRFEMLGVVLKSGAWCPRCEGRT